MLVTRATCAVRVAPKVNMPEVADIIVLRLHGRDSICWNRSDRARDVPQYGKDYTCRVGDVSWRGALERGALDAIHKSTDRGSGDVWG